MDILKAVKTVWPHNLPLFVRISATDWVDLGWDVEETVQLAVKLKEAEVDLIDCSSGGLVPFARIPFKPGYQVPFAERIKKETSILTGAVGLITTVEQAEDILEQEKADIILLGRESLREPYFALKAAAKTGDKIDWPLQYLRAKL